MPEKFTHPTPRTGGGSSCCARTRADTVAMGTAHSTPAGHRSCVSNSSPALWCSIHTWRVQQLLASSCSCNPCTLLTVHADPEQSCRASCLVYVQHGLLIAQV